MSANELKTLAKIVKNGWKQLALADQTDADSVLDVVKSLLEELETLEGAE